MWMGNPILTMVLFGLPAGFLSLICYGICCPDILDADEEEDGNFLLRFYLLCNFKSFHNLTFSENIAGSHMKKD